MDFIQYFDTSVATSPYVEKESPLDLRIQDRDRDQILCSSSSVESIVQHSTFPPLHTHSLPLYQWPSHRSTDIVDLGKFGSPSVGSLSVFCSSCDLPLYPILHVPGENPPTPFPTGRGGGRCKRSVGRTVGTTCKLCSSILNHGRKLLAPEEVHE